MKLRRLVSSLLATAVVLCAGGEALCQPIPPPPFTINRKLTLAQANRGGRVELDYDLTGVGAASMLLECYRFDGPKGGTRVRDWMLVQPRGHQRLAFNDMPPAVYYFKCSLRDSANQPIAANFRAVQLEYGGWSGRLRNERATQQAASQPGKPLDGIVVEPTVVEGDAYNFHVEPSALVVAPGRTGSLAAMLNQVLMAEPLAWKLEGPGRLVITENCLATYLADKGGEGQRATIHVESQTHPNLQADIQVLVSGQGTTSTEKP